MSYHLSLTAQDFADLPQAQCLYVLLRGRAKAVNAANGRAAGLLRRFAMGDIPPAGLGFAKLSGERMLYDYEPYLSAETRGDLEEALPRIQEAIVEHATQLIAERVEEISSGLAGSGLARDEQTAVPGLFSARRSAYRGPVTRAQALSLSPAAPIADERDAFDLATVAKDRHSLQAVLAMHGDGLQKAALKVMPAEFWRGVRTAHHELWTRIQNDGLRSIKGEPEDDWRRARIASFKAQVLELHERVTDLYYSHGLSATQGAKGFEPAFRLRDRFIDRLSRIEERAHMRKTAAALTLARLEERAKLSPGETARRFHFASGYFRGLAEAALSNRDPRHKESVRRMMAKEDWPDMPSLMRVMTLWEETNRGLVVGSIERRSNLWLAAAAGATSVLMASPLLPRGWAAAALAACVLSLFMFFRGRFAARRFSAVKASLRETLRKLGGPVPY